MQLVRFEKHSPSIALVTIDRPEVHNALNFLAIEQFAAAIERAHADPALRVLVLTGAGKRAFCAGGDLRELASYVTEADGRLVSAGMTAALDRLEALPVPTIAALNGLARGGGAEISLACDLRWMSSDATWGFTQANLGVTPGWGSGQRLLRTVGYSRALAWLLEARVLTSEEALANGVASKLLPPESLLPEVLAYAGRIASRPVSLLQGIKQVLRAGLDQSSEDAARTEREIFPPLWASDAHHAAVDRFLKRNTD